MKPLDFIQIVAEELSISEEKSQKLLAEFTTHLNNELNNTNAVQLPGLGILKKDATLLCWLIPRGGKIRFCFQVKSLSNLFLCFLNIRRIIRKA